VEEGREQKLYLTIGEVSRLLGVRPSTLRYWERQFEQLRPHRSSSGRRLYRREDLRVLRLLKRMLREEGVTIRGARSRLAQELAAPPASGEPGQLHGVLQEVLGELRELRELLRRPL